jgi:hypothetical protein
MTMANAPLGDGTAGDIEVIWVSREQEYFCKRGWTQIADLPVRHHQHGLVLAAARPD